MSEDPQPPCDPARTESPAVATRRGSARFATTQWSMVLQAGRDSSPEAHDALERLCRIYWYPLYAHVRRRGIPAEDAQDLTQQFFAGLLERRLLAKADRQRGRFRSFVLTALDHFLHDARDKARAQKRGGGEVPLPIDLVGAERRFERELGDPAAPDKAFDRQWALTLLESVLAALGAEYQRQGQAALFAALRPTLTSGGAEAYAQVAARLGLSEGAVKVAAHRLRQRYRSRLQAEIAETVAAPEDVADEMRYLIRIFGEP